MPKVPKATLNLRIAPSLKADAGRAAQADRRLLPAYIETLIEQAPRMKPGRRSVSSAPRSGPKTAWNIRIDPALKTVAERAAKAASMSLNAYIEMLIEHDLGARETPRRGKPA